MNKDKAKKKLLARIEKTESGCWEWQGARSGGYGAIGIEGVQWWCHRLSYFLYKGELLPGKSVCHRCDNPPCCNPDHLFLGSAKENATDRSQKGRSAYGSKNGNSKLSESDVKSIRERYQGRYGELAQLAKEFDVCVDTIRKIVRGWNWMTGKPEVTWETSYDVHADRPPRPEDVRERIRSSLKGRKRPQEVIDRIRATRLANKLKRTNS